MNKMSCCGLALLAALALFARPGNSQVWSSLGSGLNGYVYALASDSGGNIYAGGTFTASRGTALGAIARWSGTNWAALGSGMDNEVCALAVDSRGNLYAAGAFTNAGGVSANNIAMWNGTAWSPLGSGLDVFISPGVNALAIDGNDILYAGGYITNAGGVPVNYIARWDGTNWSGIGPGLDNRIDALAVDSSGNLYAGGWFTNAAGSGARHIARWDGTSWSALGEGLNFAAFAIAPDTNGNLYVGGHFTTAGVVAAASVAKWDGAAWSAMGPGMNETCHSMLVAPDGKLYAGGYFTNAGGRAAACIAMWDGTAWTNLGSGLTAPDFPGVLALARDAGGNIIAGGSFTNAGGLEAYNVAKWRVPSQVVTNLPPPTGITATDGTLTGRVAVTWNAVEGADGYEIWNSDVNNIGTASMIGNSAATEYDDTTAGARAGLMKYYWLRAWNTSVTGAFSGVDSGYALPEVGAEIISGQPASADYDGDRLADPAVYHLNSGRLYIWVSSAGYSLLEPAVRFHVDSGEVPAFGDYDGDGFVDAGVFSATTGTWYVWLSSAGYYRVGPVLFGVNANDIPVPADYDGDRK
ncbi:MAG: hypothetical protein WC299_07115, partial [Kiritimatiellia bacterium]